MGCGRGRPLALSTRRKCCWLRTVSRHGTAHAPLPDVVLQVAQLQRSLQESNSAKAAADHSLREREVQLARLRQTSGASPSSRGTSVRDQVATLEATVRAAIPTAERAAQTDVNAVVPVETHTARVAEQLAGKARAEQAAQDLRRELDAARAALRAAGSRGAEADAAQAEVEEWKRRARRAREELQEVQVRPRLCASLVSRRARGTRSLTCCHCLLLVRRMWLLHRVLWGRPRRRWRRCVRLCAS